MADTIRGPVTNVVDGDTFDMDVTHTGKSNQNTYNDSERVRIANVDAPELGTVAGTNARNNLYVKIAGKDVRCYIQARDVYRRIVADIELV